MDNGERIPLTNKEIADLLDVTVNTVKNYKSRNFLPQNCYQEDVKKRLEKVKEIYITVRSQNGKYAIATYRNRNSENIQQNVEVQPTDERRQIDII